MYLNILRWGLLIPVLILSSAIGAGIDYVVMTILGVDNISVNIFIFNELELWKVVVMSLLNTIGAIVFILLGTIIAPKGKKITAVVLTILKVLSAMGLAGQIMALQKNAEFYVYLPAIMPCAAACWCCFFVCDGWILSHSKGA